ncbi:MAG: hypothetical protein ACSW8C_00390 [bacterium]
MCHCVRKLLCWFNCGLLTVACLCGEVYAGSGSSKGVEKEEKEPKPFCLLPEEVHEFSEFCDTLYENFRKKDQLIEIPSEKKKQYMDYICEIGELNNTLLAKTDEESPCTCYDFLCNFVLFWEQVLRYPDSAKEILEQSISKNPGVSRAYVLLFLADGFIKEFLEVATQKLSLASIWEVYGQFSKLREKLAGMSEEVKKGVFGVSQEFVAGKLCKMRKFLTEALLNEAIIMRSSNNEIVAIQERIGTLVSSEGLADEKEFLNSLSDSYDGVLLKRSEELANLPTLQESASKVFLPSALNHINAFEPFARIRHSGSSDALYCFRTGLFEKGNGLQLFYFFSLESLENAGTGIAEILCCISRGSEVLFRKDKQECESVSLWGFPALKLEERTEEAKKLNKEVTDRTGRLVRGSLNPDLVALCNVQGIQPLNSVTGGTCSETNLGQERAVIAYDSVEKKISAGSDAFTLVSLFLFNGYYDAIEGKMVLKFVNNNAGEMRCLEIPILIDGWQVKCVVFLYPTDVLMMRGFRCFMEERQGEYYDKSTGNQILGISHKKDLSFNLEDLEKNRKKLLRSLSDEFSRLGIKEPDEKTEFGTAYYAMKKDFSWTEEAEEKLLCLWEEEKSRVLKLKAEEKAKQEEAERKQREEEERKAEEARQEKLRGQIGELLSQLFQDGLEGYLTGKEKIFVEDLSPENVELNELQVEQLSVLVKQAKLDKERCIIEREKETTIAGRKAEIDALKRRHEGLEGYFGGGFEDLIMSIESAVESFDGQWNSEKIYDLREKLNDAEQRKIEAERKAKEAKEKAELEEAERKQREEAEKARKAEEAKQKQLEEEKRVAEEKARLAKEKAELEEAERKQREEAEKARKAEEAKQKQLEEEKRLAEEKARKAEEARRKQLEGEKLLATRGYSKEDVVAALSKLSALPYEKVLVMNWMGSKKWVSDKDLEQLQCNITQECKKRLIATLRCNSAKEFEQDVSSGK